MAQLVSFWDDHVEYREGPFVMTSLIGGYFRIESEEVGHYCPVSPDESIFQLLEHELGFGHIKLQDREKIGEAVDWLNGLVREDRIVLMDDNRWRVAA